MRKLIIETGKYQTKKHGYPVRIHATDGGVNGDRIHGDYKHPTDGWCVTTWLKDGERFSDAWFDLVPTPQSVYFDICESGDGYLLASSFSECIEDSRFIGISHGELKKVGTYKYTDGVIERVEQSDNDNEN